MFDSQVVRFGPDDFRLLREQRSEALFVLAPGASINDLPMSAWYRFQEFDSLGVNLAILHPFHCRFYLGEVGMDKLGYWNFVRQKALQTRDFDVLLKGYSTPRKARLFFRDLRAATATCPNRLLLSDETYQQDLNCSLSEHISLGSCSEVRALHIAGSSLLAALDFALCIGYRSVHLAGFDFSTDYFWGNRPPAGLRSWQPHTNPLGSRGAEILLTRLQVYLDFFKKQGIRVEAVTPLGPLSNLIKQKFCQ